VGVSLKDVALRAGVSVRTASKVVNGSTHLRPDTRDRVLRAVAELGYRPNLTARQLRSGRTGLITMALPDLAGPYFAELAGQVIETAARYGRTVLLEHTGGSYEREVAVCGGARSHLADGLILSPVRLAEEDLRARADRSPLVLLGGSAYQVPYDHIAIDDVAAARTAVRHLAALGRRRIAFLGAGADRGRRQAELRLRGWREELTAAGGVAHPCLVAATDGPGRQDGTAAMTRLLAECDRRGRQAPDAVFAYNDQMALGAMRALAQHGLRVPEDVAVVGFDDTDEGRYATVSLTTVAPDTAAIARLAVTRLLERITWDTGAPPPAPVRITPGHTLVVRESTAGRSGTGRAPPDAGPAAATRSHLPAPAARRGGRPSSEEPYDSPLPGPLRVRHHRRRGPGGPLDARLRHRRPRRSAHLRRDPAQPDGARPRGRGPVRRAQPADRRRLRAAQPLLRRRRRPVRQPDRRRRLHPGRGRALRTGQRPRPRAARRPRRLPPPAVAGGGRRRG
jgi:DNA-binding LacI/PurR family transcriptional regulator